jgi:hypothetical protein
MPSPLLPAGGGGMHRIQLRNQKKSAEIRGQQSLCLWANLWVGTGIWVP